MNAERSLIKQCIDAFFNILSPIPEYNFIHKAIFFQQWQSGDLDTILLKAVCGCSARYLSDGVVTNKQGGRWTEEAQAGVLSAFDRPSIVRLQALHLIVLHYQAMRDYRKVLSLFALCTRMAFLLRLNYEDPTLPFLAQESRRRLMWSIWTTDTFLAGGIPDFTMCRTSQVHHVRLPCEESNFQLDRAVESEHLHPESGVFDSSRIDLVAHYIRVIDIRDRILR